MITKPAGKRTFQNFRFQARSKTAGELMYLPASYLTVRPSASPSAREVPKKSLCQNSYNL